MGDDDEISHTLKEKKKRQIRVIMVFFLNFLDFFNFVTISTIGSCHTLCNSYFRQELVLAGRQ